MFPLAWFSLGWGEVRIQSRIYYRRRLVDFFAAANDVVQHRGDFGGVSGQRWWPYARRGVGRRPGWVYASWTLPDCCPGSPPTVGSQT